MSDQVEATQSPDQSYPPLWKNLDFLRLLIGRLVTNAGDSLYAVAAVWLVHDITHSTVYTGIAEALLLLPIVLQFISGPLVDRWPIIRTLVSIQIVQAIAILSLPVAMYTGNLSVELILVVIPFLALFNQFVYPAQTAALPQILPDEQLARGNSAFAFVYHGVDMLFEALGGVLIALVGAATLFMLDSATFVLAALLFAGVNISRTDNLDDADDADDEEEADTIDVSGYIDDLIEGFQCLRGTVFVEMVIATAVVNFGVGMTLAVLPNFADIRAGPALFGAMLGALGVGSAVGSALTSKLEHVKFGHVRVFGAAISCVLWLGSVYAPWPPLTIALFLLAWVPPGIQSVMSETFEQTVTPNHLLGRVASVTASASTLTLPVGALFGGLLGNYIGSVNTMVVCGLAFGVVSIYSALRPRLRGLPAMNNIDPDDYDIGDTSPSSAE